MRFFELFPHRVCINLDRRHDRWQRMEARFARHGVEGVERFSAVDGPRVEIPPGWPWSAGQYGCLMSHQAVVREAKRRGLPSVLVFEDDVDFAAELEARLDRCVEQLPAEWDILLLGAIHQDEPREVTENVYRLVRSNSAHAYAIHARAYDAFIDLNERVPDAIDTNMTRLQTTHQCYCFFPHLAWVAADYSDTRGKSVNEGWLKESLILSGRRMDEVLRDSALVISFSAEGRGDAWIAGCRYLLDHACTSAPGALVVVVEQGPTPRLDPGGLPAGCRYAFLPNDGQCRRERAFDVGARMAEERGILFFLDSDIYIAARDLRANLSMGRRYDLVSGFGGLYDLDDAASERLLAGVRRFDLTPEMARPDPGVFDACYVVTRGALERLGGWARAGDAAAARRARSILSVFESPNPALRLYGA